MPHSPAALRGSDSARHRWGQWRGVVPLLLLAMILAACGDTGGEGSTTTEQTVAPSTGDTGTTMGSAPTTQPEETATTSGEPSEPVTVSVAIAVPEASAIGETIDVFFDTVEAQDVGMTFEPFWAGSLLPITDTYAGITDGRATAGYLNSAYVADEAPLWTVAEVPFTTSDSEAQLRAFADLAVSDPLFSAGFEGAGLKPIFFIPLGSSTLGTHIPVDELSDLEGLRLRSTGLMEGAVQAAGAETVFIPISEVFESLQRDTVDGWSSINFEFLPVLDYQTVREYITHSGIGIAQSIAVFMNADVYSQLSDEQKAAIDAGAQAVIDQGLAILTRDQDASCAAIAEAGGTVSALSDEVNEEWRALAEQQVIDTWLSNMEAAGVARADAEDFLTRYRDTVAQYEETSTFEDGAVRCAQGS